MQKKYITDWEIHNTFVLRIEQYVMGLEVSKFSTTLTLSSVTFIFLTKLNVAMTLHSPSFLVSPHTHVHTLHLKKKGILENLEVR